MQQVNIKHLNLPNLQNFSMDVSIFYKFLWRKRVANFLLILSYKAQSKRYLQSDCHYDNSQTSFGFMLPKTNFDGRKGNFKVFFL